MIKAIIFDMGGVVIPYHKWQIFRHAAERIGISTRKLERVVPKHLDELMKGNISDYEFWKRVSKEAGKKPPKRTDDIWHKKFLAYGLKKNILSLIMSLKKHYKLGMITDTIEGTYRMHQRKGHYDLFDVVVASNVVGLVKPDPKIYKLAVKQLKAKPKECVFIDDRKENLNPARRLGMKAIHFRNVNQLKADLKRLGIKV